MVELSDLYELLGRKFTLEQLEQLNVTDIMMLMNMFNSSVMDDTLIYGDYEDYDPCKNRSNLSQSYMRVETPSFSKLLMPTICVSGIIGIILTVIVLSRKNMCTSTNCYLTSLALADLGFLTILSTKFFENRFKGHSFHTFDIYFTYAQIFLHTFLLASVWLTVMLAIERYIAICHPLRATSICTVKRARIIIINIFLFSFYCRVPNFFEQKIETICENPLFRHIALTELGGNVMYKISYAWVVDCIICAILPFFALLFLNIRLIIEIRKSTKYLSVHLGTDSNMQHVVSNEQLKITMMLISIIVVFFICQAPYVITIAFRNINQYSIGMNSAISPEHLQIIVHATMFMLALKSAFNFILYCWFSEKFWNTFKRAFCFGTCLAKHRSRRKNGHVVHSADQGVTISARKTSCMTKDTIC